MPPALQTAAKQVSPAGRTPSGRRSPSRPSHSTAVLTHRLQHRAARTLRKLAQHNLTAGQALLSWRWARQEPRTKGYLAKGQAVL
jgi:hypothetical protein